MMAETSLTVAGRRGGRGALNENALRAQARNEGLGRIGLTLPGSLLICVVLLIPVGWLFYLSAFDAGSAATQTLKNIETLASLMQLSATQLQLKCN